MLADGLALATGDDAAGDDAAGDDDPAEEDAPAVADDDPAAGEELAGDVVVDADVLAVPEPDADPLGDGLVDGPDGSDAP
jgi:hypothetical protein